jgi:glutaredoxin
MEVGVTPQDETMVRNWLFPDTASERLITLALDSADSGKPFKRFCDELKSMVPRLSIKNDSDIPVEKPAMTVGKHGNIAYRAIPTGKLLHHFLEALQSDPGQYQGVAAPVVPLLKKIELPVILKLYVSSRCPHCPLVIQHLQSLALASATIRLMIIDAESFEEKARADDVRSVPTLILDDQFRWSGPIHLEELLTICIQRNPADLSAASLRQLIEDGNAERVAAMMAESGQVFPGITALLTHPRWSVRLGAMVTVEYLAEDAPELAEQLGDRLWGDFHHLSEQVQGDVVHLLGGIPCPENRRRLNGIADGDYAASVREAAAEILAET